LVLPLSVGASLLLADDREFTNPVALIRLLDNAHVTVFNATPTMLSTVVRLGWSGSPSLTIWAGGETLPPNLAAELLPRCGVLRNVYGPTEATVYACIHEVDAADVSDTRTVPVGGPIPGARVAIVDDNGRPAPLGVTGEL